VTTETQLKPAPRPADQPASRPIVVALTGKPGSGKDTLADLITPALGFQRIAFADALRREIAESWRLPISMLTDRATKEWSIPALAIGLCSDLGFLRWCHDQGLSLSEPRSARWVMQNWGDYQRRSNPAHYAQIVARWIQRQIGIGWTRFVVTDLRYPVEAEAIAIFGARTIRLHRDTTAELAQDTAAHSSENYDLLTHHHVIDNSQGVTELAWSTLIVLRKIGVDVDVDPAALWPVDGVAGGKGGAA
jgi:hypothetical protein